MANLQLNLPAPVGNGAGTAVNVSAMGGLKTIVMNGTWVAPDKIPTVTIEVNNAAVATDGSWSPIVSFRGTGVKTISVAARWMRLSVNGYNGGAQPTVDVAASDDGTFFAALNVPSGNGVGTPLDISSLPPFKTLQVGPRFSGSVILEIATDAAGTEWASWQSMQAPGAQSQVAVAFWARIKRVGVAANDPYGAPVCNLGACDVGGGDAPTAFAVSAGSQSAMTGTVVFSNSNGVTFGMSGSSRVTASVSSLVFSNQNNVSFGLAGSTLTASVQTAGGTATGVGIVAGTATATTGAVTFSNSNGVSFGMAASVVTASYSQSTGPGAIAAGTQTATSGTMVFSNSNNVTFGMSGSTRITASASFPAETPFGVSAGTQSVSTGTLVFSASNGITFGMSGSSRITASYSQSTAPAAIGANTDTVSNGTVIFSNSNNVSFGLAGSTITASITVAAETPFGVSAGTQSVSTGTLVFSNSNGVTFGMSGSSRVTASVSTVVFSNSNNITFGLNGSTLTASASGAAETPFGVSAGTQSVSTGTLVFSNSNGVTFGMSGSSRITASYSQSTAPAAIGANTDTVSNGTIVFSNSNNINFGLNGSTITASAVAAGETPFGISAGTQSVSTGTMVFSDSNGVTFGMSGSSRVTASFSSLVYSNDNNVTFGVNAGTLTASASNAETPFGVSAGTQSVSTGTLVFSNSNGVTFGMSGSSRVTASVSSVVFSNSNNVTFGLNGSTITASASAVGGGGVAIAAGTQTATSGTIVMSDTNGFFMGMSGSTRVTGRVASVLGTNAEPVTVSADGAALVIAAGGGANGSVLIQGRNGITLFGGSSTNTAGDISIKAQGTGIIVMSASDIQATGSRAFNFSAGSDGGFTAARSLIMQANTEVQLTAGRSIQATAVSGIYLSNNAQGGITLNAGATSDSEGMLLTAAKNIFVTAGDQFRVSVTGGGINLVAPNTANVGISGGGIMLADIGTATSLGVSLSAASGSVLAKGSNVQVSASGSLNLNGVDHVSISGGQTIYAHASYLRLQSSNNASIRFFGTDAGQSMVTITGASTNATLVLNNLLLALNSLGLISKSTT